MENSHWTTKVRGQFSRLLGWLTGDREAEAKGVVEARYGRVPDPAEHASALDEVRRHHGDRPAGRRRTG